MFVVAQEGRDSDEVINPPRFAYWRKSVRDSRRPASSAIQGARCYFRAMAREDDDTTIIKCHAHGVRWATRTPGCNGWVMAKPELNSARMARAPPSPLAAPNPGRPRSLFRSTFHQPTSTQDLLASPDPCVYPCVCRDDTSNAVTVFSASLWENSRACTTSRQDPCW